MAPLNEVALEVEEDVQDSRSQHDQVKPPPDGGYGWICVVAQFLINGFTWGVISSYSVYLAYFLSHDLFPEARALDYAFIGGFNFCFAVGVAPLTTLLTRIYGYKVPMLIGVFLFPLGFVAASFATRIWHLYLSQGVCVGIGAGFIFLPSTAITPQWFAKKRSLAIGICSAGSGIGAIIICFATEAMLQRLGLSWSLRVTAIIVFVVNSFATIILRSRNEEIQPIHRMFDFNLFKQYHVCLLLAWGVISMFGYITVLYSLSDYTLAIGRSSSDSATVAAILNVGVATGRPLTGFVSDRYGRLEVAGILTFINAVLVFALWVPAKAYGTLLVFALFSGTIVGVFWTVITPLAAEVIGLKKLPSLLTLIWLSLVLPTTFAEVIALQLRRPGLGARSYLYPQIFSGLSYVVASLLLLELWRSRRAKSQNK